MSSTPIKYQKKFILKSKIGEVLACPKCNGQLKEKGDELFCPFCRKKYSMQDGVFRASENKYYWGEIAQEQSQKLLTKAQEIGWFKALESMEKDLGDSLFKSITRANRADWRFNLPLNRKARVLDVGSGWGQIPFLLTETYDEVWSLEYVKERIDWQQIRRDQEGINNLFLVQSNVINMPFLNKTFDVISMNSVLEWVGLAESKKNVGNIQMQVLSKIMRMLKPGGYLYMGVDNRIGYNTFMGNLDHSGMKFTNLMPRWLANFYIRTLKKNSYRTKEGQKSYRTYTYSPSKYRKILLEAGFSKIDIFWVQPSHNNPMSFSPINENRMIDFYFKQIVSPNLLKWFAKQILRIFILCGFMRLFSPHLLIYAQKGK